MTNLVRPNTILILETKNSFNKPLKFFKIDSENLRSMIPANLEFN